jgi:L-ascorbate metabolism protein UlaG (beta-lactamase superfamily)
MRSHDDPPVVIHFIGNATLLIRYGPLTLLTDPNFLHRGRYAYLGYGLFTKRLTEPALGLDELPARPDAVVLSHLHGDHWDRTARRGLDRKLPILTTPHAARRLRGLHRFGAAAGLRTWESRELTRGAYQVRVIAMPGQHALGPLRLALPPVMGSVLEFGQAGGPVRIRLYISGDTLLFDGLRAIAERYPDLDVALLHLGGTRLPGGFVVTLDGAGGAELAELIGSRRVLPIHYEDYSVMKSPLGDFLAAADRRGLGERVVPWRHGQEATVEPGTSTVTVV